MFDDIGFELINGVDEKKVQELADDMLTNGWQGAPILYHNSIGLITGSHRMAALNKIEEMYDNDELTDEQIEMAELIDSEQEYALDVTEIVDDWMEENPEYGFEFDRIGMIFEGTEVEEWKEEIAEW